jgi:hypothetical protein
MGISFFINPAVYGSGGSGLPVIGSTLTHHYKTDGGITKDGSNRISQWDDESGNGNHLVQLTGSAQPLHNSANQLNGFDAISLAGTKTTAEFLSSTGTLAFNSTIFIVFKVEYDGPGHDYYDVISSQYNTGAYGEVKIMSVWSLVGSGVKINVRDRSQALSPYRKEWNNYLFGKNTTVYATLNINAPTGTSIRINGVDGGAGSESGTNFESSITGWNLGRMENNNIGFDGDIWEIIIYDGNVTGDDRTSIETYIKDKYAL